MLQLIVKNEANVEMHWTTIPFMAFKGDYLTSPAPINIQLKDIQLFHEMLSQ